MGNSEQISVGAIGTGAWAACTPRIYTPACIASLRSGSPQKVAKLDPPALYGEGVEAAK